jgi:hypothetical protein
VTVLSDGVVQQELACPLQGGGVLVWMHSGIPVRLQRLVIEGMFAPESTSRLRRASIERALAASFPAVGR